MTHTRPSSSLKIPSRAAAEKRIKELAKNFKTQSSRARKTGSRKAKELAQEAARQQTKLKNQIKSREAAEKIVRQKAEAAAAAKAAKPKVEVRKVSREQFTQEFGTKEERQTAIRKKAEGKEVSNTTRAIETIKIAFNPFSKEKIVSTTDNRVFNTAAEYVANNPGMAALIIAASGFQTLQVSTATFSRLTGGSSLARALAARGVEVNTKTAKLTAGFLSKIAAATKTPAFVYTALAVIGTYPFTYFIREEALQAIKGTYTGAIINGNFEQAQIAIDERNQILNPELWEKIITAFPFANSVKELLDLFNTARIAVKIDQQVLDDLRIQEETEESEEDKWKRIRETELEQEKALSQMYTYEAKKLALWKSSLERKDMLQAAKFWEKEAAKQRELEAKDREAIAEFWINYRKEIQKIEEAGKPGSSWNLGQSNLNFGLL